MSTSGALSALELPIQNTTWKPTGQKPDNVAYQAQLPLHNLMLHALYVGSLPDLNVGDLVPPSDAEDSLQALEMKGFKDFDISSVQCPG